jgi:hypothetical protein
MSDRLSHSELCGLLAGLMEDRVVLETRPLAGPDEPRRLWKYTMAHVDRLAEDRGMSRIEMLAHLVYLGLAVDASTVETLSRLIDDL